MQLKKYSLLILLTFLSIIGFSQNELSGTITDSANHAPLAGVSVYIPDLKLGATTDADGKYSIQNTPHGTFLAIVSVIGYASQTKEVEMKETAVIDFVLQESGTALNEVIVTGVSTATELKNN